MSFLSTIKLTHSQPVKSNNVVEQRRNKLIEKLAEQLELVTAKLEGRVYTPTVTRTRVNSETGMKESFVASKRVREWFWINTDGMIHLQIRYGSRVMELAKGKNAIVVADLNELQSTLEAVKHAVAAGELDALMEAASTKVKEGFKK